MIPVVDETLGVGSKANQVASLFELVVDFLGKSLAGISRIARISQDLMVIAFSRDWGEHRNSKLVTAYRIARVRYCECDVGVLKNLKSHPVNFVHCYTD